MKRKVIWIFNQYSGSKYHGMNYRSYYLGYEFVKKGYDVYIFAASFNHLFFKFPKTSTMFTKEIIDAMSYMWVKIRPYSGSKSFGRLWSMISYCIKLFFVPFLKISRPDAIIVSSISPFPIIPAALFKLIYRVPLIFEVRDIWPLSLKELGGYSSCNPFIVLLQCVENFAYRVSDATVSLLPYAFDHMKYHGLKQSKFHYIPNGISEDEIPESELIKSSFEGIPKDAFIVGYTGTIGIANAMSFFIESANLCSNFKNIYFVIVGNGDDESALKVVASNPNILFFDAVSKSDVFSVISSCSIMYHGCLNKRIYGYGLSPNKIFDYMVCKKPIVHAVSTRHNIVKDADCGVWVPSENPQLLADAILHMSTLDTKDLARMGKNGYNYVLKYHSYAYLSAKYYDLLQSLFHKKSKNIF